MVAERDELDTMLSFDAVDFAEKHGGTTGDAMLLHMMHGQAKRAELSRRKDTHYGISFEGAIEVINSIEGTNFKVMYEKWFPSNHEGKYDTEILYWDEDNHLLISLESYGEHVNMLKVYGCLANTDSKKLFPALSGCSHDPVEIYDQATCSTYPAKTVNFDFDGREGLRHKLASIMSTAKFVPWEGRRFMWLSNYMEQREPGHDYKAIADQKLRPWFPFMETINS